jgi:tetratricopeptide (TPR) repeat protein
MVVDACLRQGILPQSRAVETPLTPDAAAACESLRSADIYICVMGRQYGAGPPGKNRSWTEIEFDLAVKLGLPRLVYLPDENHLFTIKDIDTDSATVVRLTKFLTKLKNKAACKYYRSADDLRAQVINDLSSYRSSVAEAGPGQVSRPKPPTPYIPHPYSLLQTRDLVGRSREIDALDAWLDSAENEVPVFVVVAVGGMGKSALTWHWFKTAVRRRRQLAGAFWWSFYEQRADYENFVLHALAYVTGESLEQTAKKSLPQREDELFLALTTRPFLFVLDGLERILVAYARADAARLPDDTPDVRSAGFVLGASGPQLSSPEAGGHPLRRTIDPRAGRFLKKLATVAQSRVLISTRLFPSELQSRSGAELPGCKEYLLPSLNEADAHQLWTAFGCRGSVERLDRVFRTFDMHPLMICVLAGLVAENRTAPGDFDSWRAVHPSFNPFELPLVQVKSHILAHALAGLAPNTYQTLTTIAAFRMPAHYETLSALLIGEGKTYHDHASFDRALGELEDRGLLGWDRGRNLYDLHPIVRGVAWNATMGDGREALLEKLRGHFAEKTHWSGEPDRPPDEWHAVSRPNFGTASRPTGGIVDFDDLTPSVELYNALIGLRRYDDACSLFHDRLSYATLYRLNANRQRTELLEMLFCDGLDKPPRLTSKRAQVYVLHTMAHSFKFLGDLVRAASYHRRANTIDEEMGAPDSLMVGLGQESDSLRLSGRIYDAEIAALRALDISRLRNNPSIEADSLYWLGQTLGNRGSDKFRVAFTRSIRLARLTDAYQAYDLFGLAESYAGNAAAAKVWAEHARAWFTKVGFTRGVIRALWILADAELQLGRHDRAEELTTQTIARAREVGLKQQEIGAVITQAELRRREGDCDAGRSLLSDVWEPLQAGPFRMQHADALNTLARLEHQAGRRQPAIDAATKAYREAWCDGFPYVFKRGVDEASRLLRELGESPPESPSEAAQPPPVDLVTWERVNPDDEHHIRQADLDDLFAAGPNSEPPGRKGAV